MFFFFFQKSKNHHPPAAREEFARYWRTISFPDDVSPHTEARDEYGNPVEEDDEPGFWPDEEEAWPRNVGKGEHVSRAQAVAACKCIMNFIKANPHAYRNMEGGAGVAYSNMEACLRAVQTCKDVVGEKSLQPTMERYLRAREDDHGP